MTIKHYVLDITGEVEIAVDDTFQFDDDLKRFGFDDLNALLTHIMVSATNGIYPDRLDLPEEAAAIKDISFSVWSDGAIRNTD
jgi:hypothetical protein